MATSNSRDIRKEIDQRWRNRAREAAGVLNSYEDQGGAPRDVQGDEEAPWHKAPPFTEDPQLWIRPTLLAANAYTTLPEIETKQYRLLAVYLTYAIPQVGAPAPPQGVGQLGIIPEMRSLDPTPGQGQMETWYTMAMVDLAFAVTTPTAAPFNALAAGFATQNFLPTQLRWPPNPIGPVAAATTLRTRLLFDVSDAEAFRLNVIELNAASTGENSFSALFARSQ